MKACPRPGRPMPHRRAPPCSRCRPAPCPCAPPPRHRAAGGRRRQLPHHRRLRRLRLGHRRLAGRPGRTPPGAGGPARRHHPRPAARGAGAAPARRGGALRCAALDIADAAQLRALVDRLGPEQPPLKGVLHTAGVLDDTLVTDLDAARLAAVFEPKARGAVLASLDADRQRRPGQLRGGQCLPGRSRRIPPGADCTPPASIGARWPTPGGPRPSARCRSTHGASASKPSPPTDATRTLERRGGPRLGRHAGSAVTDRRAAAASWRCWPNEWAALLAPYHRACPSTASRWPHARCHTRASSAHHDFR